MKYNYLIEGDNDAQNVAYAIILGDSCYVGQTIMTAKKRLNVHLVDAIYKNRNSNIQQKLKEYVTLNKPILVKQVQCEKSELFSAEGLLFKKMEKLGYNMLNYVDCTKYIKKNDRIGK